MKNHFFINVLINIPLNKFFTYKADIKYKKSIKIGSPAVGGLLSGSSSSGRGGRCFDPVSADLVPVYLAGTVFGLVAGQTLVRQDPNVHRVQLDHAAAGDSFAA